MRVIRNGEDFWQMMADSVDVSVDEFDILDVLAAGDESTANLAATLHSGWCDDEELAEWEITDQLERLEKRGYIQHAGEDDEDDVWGLTEKGAIPFGGLD